MNHYLWQVDFGREVVLESFILQGSWDAGSTHQVSLLLGIQNGTMHVYKSNNGLDKATI